MKAWNELTFADDFIFCKVLEDNELCKRFVGTLLRIKIDKIVKNSSQETVKNGKSVGNN